MDTDITRLTAFLTEEADIFKQMLAALEMEKDAALRADLDALVDFLEYAGPVQTGLRSVFGWQSARDYWFPEIRSLGGAAAMLTLVLYPYVYLLARAAFLQQSATAFLAARALGGSRHRLRGTAELAVAVEDVTR